MNKLSKRALHISAMSLGLCVVVLYVLSRQIPRAEELYSISKLVEWTGMVFVPLWGLNLDLYPEPSAKAAGIAMLAIHTAILCMCYRILPDLNYIAIAAIAILEMFVLVVPFLIIRKRLASESRLCHRPK